MYVSHCPPQLFLRAPVAKGFDRSTVKGFDLSQMTEKKVYPHNVVHVSIANVLAMKDS